MGGFVIDLFLFVGLLALAWILFVIWLVWYALSGVLRGLGVMSKKNGNALPARICTHLRCGGVNPIRANFCKRCGSPLVPQARGRVAA